MPCNLLVVTFIAEMPSCASRIYTKLSTMYNWPFISSFSSHSIGYTTNNYVVYAYVDFTTLLLLKNNIFINQADFTQCLNLDLEFMIILSLTLTSKIF